MNPSALNEWDMLIRLGLSFAAGAVIGFERSTHRQVAGLRTHILIAMGACLLMLLSIWLPQTFLGMNNGDPGRIAAQVVSGIGFLGAGAIIRLGNNVRGLTTAASLWFIAAVGLAIGAGMFAAAGMAEAAGLFTLFVLGKFEKKVFPTERIKVLEITYKNSATDTKEALDIISASGLRIQSMDVNQGAKDRGTRLRLLVSIPSAADIASIAKQIKASGHVGKVEIKEKY
ncbi:MAG: MgtC/SapB family protein [Treponema sp.]|nr:MgtC/SapB family protein [Treponema sp.]